MNDISGNGAAYILIGGSSSRFGSPKWEAVIKGETILDKSWSLCREHFQIITLVAKEKMDLEKPVIYDLIKVNAPFSGLYTALASSKHQWNLILSCDLPLITGAVIQKLLDNRSREFDVIIPKTRRGIEPLCALYSAQCFPVLEDMKRNENYTLHDIVAQCRTKKVDFRSRSDLFLNVNTPEDLKKAEAMLKRDHKN